MHILPSLHMVIGFLDHIYVFNPLRQKSPEGTCTYNQPYLLLTTESEILHLFPLRFSIWYVTTGGFEINSFIRLF